MASAKERCFKQAAFAYEQGTGQDLGLEFEQPWRQLANGAWETTTNWWSAVNSMRFGNATQIRRPDLTVNGDTVVDLKFTRADGTKDTWGTRPGAGNGNTQLEDYNDINEQHNPDFENDDPRLDRDTCECDENGSDGVGVLVPETDPAYESMFGTGGIPRGVPRGAPVRIPIRIPFPIPIPIPSSQDYKKDIAPVDLHADRLLDVDVKSFKWRKDGSADIGVIAQEIQEKVPELFYQDAGFTGIQADHLPYYLLQLLQAQSTQIAALTAKLDTLEGALREQK